MDWSFFIISYKKNCYLLWIVPELSIFHYECDAVFPLLLFSRIIECVILYVIFYFVFPSNSAVPKPPMCAFSFLLQFLPFFPLKALFLCFNCQILCFPFVKSFYLYFSLLVFYSLTSFFLNHFHCIKVVNSVRSCSWISFLISENHIFSQTSVIGEQVLSKIRKYTSDKHKK